MESALSLPSSDEHASWLKSRRRQLMRLLGDLPSAAPVRGKTSERREERERFVEQVAYEGEEGEQIPAVLLIPRNHPLPLPGIICLHSQGPDRKKGKSEVVVNSGLGAELCRRGYVVLAPEVPGYEDRRKVAEEAESGRLLLQSWSLPARTAWEVRRAVDYLGTRSEVERGRVGLTGLAKGGMIGWLTAAIEPRIAAVAICWGTSTYAAILAEKISLGPMGWIPGLLNWGDTPEICSLIAPRPLLFCAAQQDPLFPFGGFQEAFWRVRQFYSRLKEAERLGNYVLPGAPKLDKEIRARVANWFDRWL